MMAMKSVHYTGLAESSSFCSDSKAMLDPSIPSDHQRVTNQSENGVFINNDKDARSTV